MATIPLLATMQKLLEVWFSRCTSDMSVTAWFPLSALADSNKPCIGVVRAVVATSKGLNNKAE